MISVVLDERCTGCGRCIEICPTDVFEERAGRHPRIARVLDCQTCFACELHCPADAIYVDPNCEAPRSVAAEVASIAPSLGQYRLNGGWGEHPEVNPNEFWMMERGFEWAFVERAREQAATQSWKGKGTRSTGLRVAMFVVEEYGWRGPRNAWHPERSRANGTAIQRRRALGSAM